MKIVKPILLTFSLLLMTSFAYADTLTLTTYYPAPFGAYDRMRLVPRSALVGACDIGTLYVDDGDFSLKICTTGDWSTSSTMGAWEEVPVGGNIHIYPKNDGPTTYIGLGLTAPEFKLNIDGSTSGILASGGAIGAGEDLSSTTVQPNGASFLWYPRRAAFRAGFVSANEWDDGNIGNHSVALGEDMQVSGANSFGLGEDMTVSGNNSVGIALSDQNNADLTDNNVMAIMGGAVGIGVLSPTAELDVLGNISSSINITAGANVTAGTDVNATSNVNAGNDITASNDITAAQNVTATAGNITATVGDIIATAGNITATAGNLEVTAGNAGFGAAPTANRLEVDGNVRIINTNIGVNKDPDGSYDIDAVGDIRALGFVYSSDKRLKKNIKPVSSALDKIAKLEGVTFLWKKSDDKDMGVIAQDVEKVFPELVAVDGAGMKSVKYPNLVAPLIEAVKEQKKIVEDQDAKIKMLEEKIEALEKMIEGMGK